MCCSTYATNTLYESPKVTRITIFSNKFDTAPSGTRRQCVLYLTTRFINFLSTVNDLQYGKSDLLLRVSLVTSSHYYVLFRPPDLLLFKRFFSFIQRIFITRKSCSTMNNNSCSGTNSSYGTGSYQQL